MTVLVLLPVERMTSFINKTSHLLVEVFFQDSHVFDADTHVSPLFFMEAGVVNHIVRLQPAHVSCHPANRTNTTSWQHSTAIGDQLSDALEKTVEVEESCSILESDCEEGCNYIFASTGLSDKMVGAIIVTCSVIVFLCSYVVFYRCLKMMVDDSLNICGDWLKGSWLNRFPYVTDMVLFLGGVGVTLFSWSSSVVTSAMVVMVSQISE